VLGKGREMKNFVELVEELVNVSYEVEKIKYPSTAERSAGWIVSSYALAYGLEMGISKTQILETLQTRIDEQKRELATLTRLDS
jgi:signal recognition particle subunit SEC65